MALRDDALNFLRQVFGRDRAERDRAESPSAEAEKHIPTSIFSVWGREDVGGLLSVSQNLMDRYADYEQMDDYPDINCLSGDTTIYVVEGSVIKPFRLHDLAAHGGGVEIIAYDEKAQKLTKVAAGNPRVTGNKVDVVEVGFSNGEKIKCTPDHKFLTVEHGYINASDMIVGTAVVAVWSGFDAQGMSTFLHPISSMLRVTQAAAPAGSEDVYDVTTKTHNFIANGVVVHNSTHHYFTNDATQPDIDTGKTVWVHSNDEAIKDMTGTLLDKRLKIEDDIWSMVYTMTKYGNNFEEVLVTENGVVGLNSLPCPTMRRVEQSNGAVIGYVQDVTGKFTQDAADLRGMLAGQTKIPDHVALFEEWQVLHSRLRGTARRSPYGYCIPADGKVWTTRGLVPIDEVEPGDRVVNRHAGLLRTTPVVDTFDSGEKEVFRLKTTHREVRASANHPFLVRRGNINRWKKLRELEIGDEVVAATTMPEIAPKQPFGIVLDYVDDDTQVSFTRRGAAAIRTACEVPQKCGPRRVGLRSIFRELGIARKVAERLLDGGSSVSSSQAKAVLEAVGLQMFDGAVQIKRKGNTPRLAAFVTSSFARLYGFLLGDGWTSKNAVSFARGDNEETNAFYEDLLCRETGLDVSISSDNTKATVHSTELVRAFETLGWINGAHYKKVPEWLYGQSTEIREAFLEGFVDADGWTSSQYDKTRYHTELCNRGLVEGLKALVDGLGWTCGNVRVRAARTSKIAAGTVRYADGAVLPESEIRGGPTYTITWHKTPLGDGDFTHERIKSIESEGIEKVFDIQVADTDHNFVCNGLVVHNSVADGARWIWKRLVLLEDAMLIYKLCLRGDSQIWTPEGQTQIKDLVVGDAVYSFGHDGRLHHTRVTYKKNNGPDQLYEIKSENFELHANKTHPVLTHISGDALEYVEVQNLVPGVHHFVAPCRPDGGFAIEPILSIERQSIENVWDIGVEAAEHNFVADGVVVHNTRAPARFAFYIDVTDIPSDKVDSFLRKAKQDLRKQKLVNPRCLTAETPVTCLDGKDRSMRELAEEVPKLAAEGKHHYVFSYDTERHRVVPGKIVGAALSGKKKPVYRVVIDNGAIVRCTGDHPFLLRNGTYKQAQDLVKGESLMPLYLSRGGKENQYYWKYKDTGLGKQCYVHQMVAEELVDPDYKSKGLHVHHRDENKENNHPENLEPLTPGEHAGGRHPVHLQEARKALKERAQTDPKFQQELYERIRDWREANPEKLSAANKKAAATKTNRADSLYNLIFAMVEQKLHNDSTITSQEMVAWLNGQEDFVRIYSDLPTTIKSNLSRGCWTALLKRRGFRSFADYKKQVVGTSARKNGPQKNKKKRLVGAGKNNHTVVSVTPDGFEDVYDITVEDYHNFALTAGVFVHNTQRLDMRFNPMDNMEDFFIAVRENRELARVEVLQGPDYQATEDVEYFQRKLHGVLKVPRSYLGQDDAPPPRTILSFEDVRAARVTMGIQREMKNTIRRLVQVDLAARGINPFSHDLQVMMTVPSGIYELAHNEIKNARADFATRVQPFVSMRYIQERVLKLSDDEITQIEKEREEDMKKQAEQQKMMGGDDGGGGGAPAPMPMDGGSGDPSAQHPGNVEVGPPPGVAGRPDNRAEWKKFDAARRLEERRHVESVRRDTEIQDSLRRVLSTQKDMAHRLEQSQQFFREMKHTYMSRNNNGQLVPQGRGRGHARKH